MLSAIQSSTFNKNLGSIYNFYHKSTCGKQNSNPQRCPCSNFSNLQICDLPWQETQVCLSYGHIDGIILDYWGKPNVITNILKRATEDIMLEAQKSRKT